MPFLKIKSKNLFNLDSTPIKIDIEDKNDIKDRWKSMKNIVGSAIGCFTALVFFMLVILYLRRRYIKLKEQKEQKVKDEAAPLR